MQTKRTTLPRQELILFFVLIGAAALGNGLSDSVYANYFKDAYNVTAQQRAFIEFPRELPGILCTFIIVLFSGMGDIKLSVVAQVLACIGLTALGLFTPSYGVMLIFLFVNSLGMHLFMPLQDAIGMSLAEEGQVGRRMGQYAAFRTAIGFVAGIIVFIGFRWGFFSFVTPIKHIFLWGAAAFVVAIAASILLMRRTGSRAISKQPIGFRFRREYTLFYVLTVLHGVQKQIAYVYGSWVIIELLRKGADIMSLLVIASSFIGIFFMHLVSKWFDRLGVRRVLFVEALAFVVLYTLLGFVVWGITQRVLPDAGWPVMVVYALFVANRLSMQLGIVRAVYLRAIAVDEKEVTATLSTGVSLDHIVSILAAQVSGWVWMQWGPQWVFFIAAALSLGNVFVALRVKGQQAAR